VLGSIKYTYLLPSYNRV